jgi:hypothetical protein
MGSLSVVPPLALPWVLRKKCLVELWLVSGVFCGTRVVHGVFDGRGWEKRGEMGRDGEKVGKLGRNWGV